jgi:hypothetical protein
MTSTPDVIPRVALSGLAEFVGRRVLLVAKVEGVDPSGTTVALGAPPPPAAAGDAAAAPPAPAPRVLVQRPAGGGGGAYDTAFVEVDGVVVDATTVREESHTNFSDNFGEREGGGGGGEGRRRRRCRRSPFLPVVCFLLTLNRPTTKPTIATTNRLQHVHGGAQDDRQAPVRVRVCLKKKRQVGKREERKDRRAACVLGPPDARRLGARCFVVNGGPKNASTVHLFYRM